MEEEKKQDGIVNYIVRRSQNFRYERKIDTMIFIAETYQDFINWEKAL